MRAGPHPGRRRLRRVLLTLAVVVGAGALVRAALPYVAKRVLVHEAERALGRPVAIQQVSLGLLQGRLTVDHASIGGGPSGKAAFRWRRLALQWSWRALWDGRVHLLGVELDAPWLQLERGPGAKPLRLAGPPRPSPPAGTAGGRPAWPVRIDRLVVRNAAVDFEDHSRVPIHVTFAPATLRAEGFELPAASRGSPPTPPWHLERLRLELTPVRVVRGGEAARVFDMDATAQAIVGPPGAAFPVHLAVRAQGKEEVHLDGAARLTPFGFSGRARWSDVNLHDLLAALAPAWAVPVQAGRSGGELELAAGSLVAGNETGTTAPLRIQGHVQVSSFALTAPDPQVFSVAWKRLDVKLRGVDSVGGVPNLELDHVHLVSPSVALTRTAGGLPLLATRARPAPSVAAPAPSPHASVAGTSTGGGSPSPGLRVRIGRLSIDGGSARFVDRTTRPFYRTHLEDLEVHAQGVTWPGPVVSNLRVTGKGPGGAPFRIQGAVDNENGRFRVRAEKIQLPPFNPYLTSFIGLSVNRGTLSFHSTVNLKLAGRRYALDNHVVLADLDLRGQRGKTLFRDELGLPLSLSLGLLQNPDGNIALDVPIRFDVHGDQVALRSVAGSALRQALLGALVTPLKLIGAVVVRNGQVQHFEPQPLPFDPGGAALTNAGKERLRDLAALLARRPGIAVQLRGATGPSDPPRLKQEALLDALRDDRAVAAGPGPSPPATTRARAELRRRIARALAERLEGKAGKLPADAEATLERWLTEEPVPKSRLAQLARQRAEAVATRLERDFGVEKGRVRLGAAEPGKGAQVEVSLEAR